MSEDRPTGASSANATLATDPFGYAQNEADRLTRRLWRSSALREVATACLRGAQALDDGSIDLAIVIAGDKRRSEKERLVATWILGTLEQTNPRREAAAACLLGLMRESSRQAARDRRFRRAGFGLAVAIVAALYFPFLLIGLIRWEVKERKRNRMLTFAGVSLSRLRAAEAVEFLVPAANDTGNGLRASNWLMPRTAAWSSLPRMFAELTPECRGSVGRDTVPGICRMMSAASLTYKVTLLDALAIVGDGRAIATVSQVARRGGTAEVRERAAAVLAILEDRKRAEEAAGVLLRPANEHAGASDTLLRAVTGVSASPPEQLLRATVSEERE